MYQYGRLWFKRVLYMMEELINGKYISFCGDNNLSTVCISHFFVNLNYRRKYDPKFLFYNIFYISCS